jgi:hypothetical protein
MFTFWRGRSLQETKRLSTHVAMLSHIVRLEETAVLF